VYTSMYVCAILLQHDEDVYAEILSLSFLAALALSR